MFGNQVKVVRDKEISRKRKNGTSEAKC